MADLITSRPGAIAILVALTVAFWVATSTGFVPPFMRDAGEQKALWSTLGGTLLLSLRVENRKSE